MRESARSYHILPVIGLLVVIAGVMVRFALAGQEYLALSTLPALLIVGLIFYRPEWGICALLVGFLFRYYRGMGGLMSPNNLIGMVLLAAMVARLVSDRSFRYLKAGGLLLFGIIVAYFLVSSAIIEGSTPTLQYKLDETAELTRMMLTRFGFLMLTVFFIRTYGEFKIVLIAFMVMALYITLSTIPGLGHEGHGGFRTVGFVISALVSNPNRFGFLCEVLIVWLWFFRRLVASKVLWTMMTAAVPMLVIITLTTASRSAFLNLVLLGVFIALHGRFNLMRQLQVVAVCVIVAALAGEFLTKKHTERLENLVPGQSSSSEIGSRSAEGRLAILLTGLKIVAAHPILGVGLGNFRQVLYDVSEGGSQKATHNSYLWAAAEGGVPALLLFLVLFFQTLKTYILVERHATNWRLRTLAAGFRISFLIFLSFSFFAEFWLNEILVLLIAFSILLKRFAEEERYTVVYLEPDGTTARSGAAPQTA